MNILFSINDNYIEHMKVLLFSILLHNRTEKLFFYFIDGNLSKENKNILEDFVGDYNAEIIFVPIDKDVFKNAPKRKNISVETYYRLLAFELLPEVDKILYLDADILVTGSLAKLYNKDISRVCVAAVSDQGLVQNDRRHKLQLGLKASDEYVNAGVLLMNLQRMRRSITGKTIFDFIEEKSHCLKYQDQDIINVLFRDELLLLEKKYNQSPLYEDKEDFRSYFSAKRRYPTIIHYMGEETKPWKEKIYGYKYLRIYYGYCKEAGAKALVKKMTLPMLLRPLAIIRQREKAVEWR